MAAAALLRRYGLLVHWLLFALLTLRAARDPGLVPEGAEVPYPWRGVAVTWAILALFSGALQLILRPRTFRRSWGRLLGALAFSLALLLGTVATTVTDLPGHAYVPAAYAFVTFAALALTTLGLLLRALWRRWTGDDDRASAPRRR